MSESHTTTLPDGFRELHGEPALLYRHLERVFMEQLSLKGFEPCQVASLEYIDLYHPERIGVDPFSNLILGRIGEWRSFSTQGNEDRSRSAADFEEETNEIALRPELTAPLLRYSLLDKKDTTPTFPLRVCASGRIFQDLDPKRQLKERGQVDAEIIGLSEGSSDAEILCHCHDLLNKVGLENVSLHVGHAALFERWIISCGIPPEHASSVLMAVRRTGFLQRLVRDENSELLSQIPWLLSRMKSRFERMVTLYGWLEEKNRPEEFDPEAEAGDFSTDHWRKRLPELQRTLVQTAWRHALHLSKDAIGEALELSEMSGDWPHFRAKADPWLNRCEASRPLLESFGKILAMAAAAGVETVIDPPPGRGFSYYNGLTFEARTPASGEALARGGRYDSLVQWLVQRYGEPQALGSDGNAPPLPYAAVGMALDLESLMAALENLSSTLSAPMLSIVSQENTFPKTFSLLRELNAVGIACRLVPENAPDDVSATMQADGTLRLSGTEQSFSTEELIRFWKEQHGQE